MIALASLLLPIAAGWAWCRALRLHGAAGLLGSALDAGLAIALGFGTSSVLFFLLSVAGLANVAVVALIEVALLAAGIFVMLRSSARLQAPTEHESSASLPQWQPHWKWSGVHYVLLAAVVLLACLAGAIAVNAYSAAPHGRWDAWSIWNLRAKYVAGEGSWRNAVSPLLSETHPEYPMATSSLIARTWLYGGRDFDPAIPAVTSGLYALAALLIVIGGLGSLRGPTVALLAGCILLSAQSWVGEIGGQYADIAISLYFISAFAMLAISLSDESSGSPDVQTRAAIQAGVCAGVAALVKNEGLAFVAALGLALLLTASGRRRFRAFAMGLAPLLLLALLYKFFVAAHDPEVAQSIGGMLSKAATPARWGAIFSIFGARLWTLGEWYAHPVILAAAVWFFFRRRDVSCALPLWIASGLMMAMYLAAYLVTPADLKWQLDTSMDRLLVQLLPAALVSLLIATATEESAPQLVAATADEVARQSSGNRKSRKK